MGKSQELRYYDLIDTPLTGKTFLEGGPNRIVSSDPSVSVYFEPVDLVKYTRDSNSGGYPTLKEYALKNNVTRYDFYLDEPDKEGIFQPDQSAEKEKKKGHERLWRDEELDWYDTYQKQSKWCLLCCVDQEALYRYYIALLEYPQSEGFPGGDRPVRPSVLCDGDITDEQRWEKSVQMELNARRLSPLTINNVMAGDSGSEVAVTVLISPTETTMSDMTAYVTESVINGLVDIWWNTDSGDSVKLTVQNLKPVFKDIEKYVRDLYEARKDLIARFGEAELLVTDNANWPSKITTLT